MKLTNAVQQWGRNKDINNPAKQYMKVIEEMGELSESYNKNHPSELKDAFGDVQITLIILAGLMGVDYEEALQEAYGVIKDRQGKSVDGVFIKDGD